VYNLEHGKNQYTNIESIDTVRELDSRSTTNKVFFEVGSLAIELDGMPPADLAVDG
jgi:hypothetical protein